MTHHIVVRYATLALAFGLPSVVATHAGEQQRDGDWLVERDEQSFVKVLTRELSLHPKPEPKPALKYRLIPDEFDRTDGNSAIYYLKAMGFLEETRARELLNEFDRKASAEAERNGLDDWPPYSWLKISPSELPIKEVKQFLRLVSFQPPLLREAADRRSFSLDRDIRAIKDPILYLLPEINTMRQLARFQSLRLRLALAEGRVDDAVQILGQQYAMAEHLGQDEFFVSNLVGIAISGIAWSDALYVVQHAEMPNLYWAFASLPKPLVGMDKAMAYERQFLFEQVKSLRDVDAQVRPAGYWEHFVDRILPELVTLASSEGEWNFDSDDPKVARATFVAVIAASYPGAKQYLIQNMNMDLATVEAYPRAQTVFLAAKLYSEHAHDEQFKWQHLPLWQAQSSPLRQQSDTQLKQDQARFGWITQPAQLMLPAGHAIMTARQRSQQNLAMLQTIEAIRLYAAMHDGQLPQTLDQLPLPAVSDPISGKPFIYERNSNNAVLRGGRAGSVRYQLVLRMAK